MSWKPSIIFSYMQPRKWKNRDLVELADEMHDLRLSIKNATGYTWDNSHFYIESIYGRIVLTVSFTNLGSDVHGNSHGGDICFWNYITGDKVGCFYKPLTDEDIKEIDKWISKIAEGKVKCLDCGKWIDPEYSQTYSFAGRVCLDCYNSEYHRPPDTSGD